MTCTEELALYKHLWIKWMALRPTELHLVASYLGCCATLTSVQPQQFHPSHKQYLGGWRMLFKSVMLQFFTVTTHCGISGIWKSVVTFYLNADYRDSALLYLTEGSLKIWFNNVTAFLNPEQGLFKRTTSITCNGNCPPVSFLKCFSSYAVSVELYLSVYHHNVLKLHDKIISVIAGSF